MRDKTEQILNAAIKVFVRKGFQATTQEIAKEANVAEITLYRKFSTKQNLFVTVIKKVLENQFEVKIMKFAEEQNTYEFFLKVLDNRLENLSQNTLLSKMLISESLMGNLTDGINFPHIIFHSLKKGIEHHFNYINKSVDVELCARQLAGILLSHVVFPDEKLYYQLEQPEKKMLVEKYAKSLLSLL